MAREAKNNLQDGIPEVVDLNEIKLRHISDLTQTAKDIGVNYIGGCCGCKATHMREMAKVLGKFSSDNVWSTKDNFPMSETEYNRNLRENN